LGTAAYHVTGLGGDDSNDAATSPPEGANGNDGIAQPAFVQQGGQWPQPGGPGTPITLTYSFQNMFDGALKMPNGQPLPAYIIRQSIEEALGLWASVAPLHFVEVPDDGRSYELGSTRFGQIRFRHTSINGADPPNGDPIAKAQAYFPFNGAPYAGDVEFDKGDPWQVVGTLRQPDVLGAAIHEIGHTIGLGHSTGTLLNEFWTYTRTNGLGQEELVQIPKGDANMYWIFTRFSGPGSGKLFADDVAGVRSIYGAGVGSVTPLFIPEPATWLTALAALVTLLTASRVVRDPVRHTRHFPSPATASR
jgi:hypothetical protein